MVESEKSLVNGQRSKRPQTGPMTVLCLGLPRTGTMSLRQAIRDLGISDVYHYNSLLEDQSDCPLWCEAFDLKFGKGNGDIPKGLTWDAEQWDRLLGHCMAISDNPCISFAEELVKTYPNAKVLLTKRDSPDAWYTSFAKTILPVEEAFHLPTYNPYHLIRRWLQYKSPFVGVIDRLSKFSPASTANFREHGREDYLAHNQNIRDMMLGQPNRFLEYNVKEGWGSLCEFLGKEVPKDEAGIVKPFPRMNDTAEFQKLWEKEESAFYEPEKGRVWGLVAFVGAAGVAAYFLQRDGPWSTSFGVR